MTDTTNGAHDDEPREGATPDGGLASAPVAGSAESQPAESASTEAPAAPAAPATGTVYEPGQAPQPYHAGQYTHQTAPQPHIQPPAQAQPQPAAPPAAGQTGPASQTGPTEPLTGTVPPAFGGPRPTPATTVTDPAVDSADTSARPRRIGLGVAAAIVAAALIGGASGAGITALMTNEQGASTSDSGAGAESIVINDEDSVNQITAVAAKASPSVVTISVSGGQAAGTGSGVVLSEDGYVLTNTHVVTLDGSTGDAAIQVKTNDGRLYDAELIGTDPLSDLAVIKLVDASALTPLEFADSDALDVGDTAIAIGAPLGLSGTVTNGIVSALNRSIDVSSSAAPTTPDDSEGDSDGDSGEGDDGTGESPFDFWNFDVPGDEGGQPQGQGSGLISIPVIQTDAAINPGNSGGALLDAEGRLIGINVAILSAGGASGEAGNIGVGFAVPSNLAERIAKELIENGEASHGLLGATVTSAEADGQSDTVGALISEVSAGGAAEAAGLQAGDVVTRFNDVLITDQTDLTAQVRALAGGSTAQITFTRNGESSTVEVTVGTFEG